MAYKTMDTNVLYDIFRRWQDRQYKSHIERATGIDRKTIRRYVKDFPAYDIHQDQTYEPDEIKIILTKLISDKNVRSCMKVNTWTPYHQEIKNLLCRDTDPFDLKSVYQILIQKYEIKSSYASLRRYMIKKGIKVLSKKTIYRIELPPGLETQIDYGKVGRLPDEHGKNRDVYAFCGILSCSRLPFIEFVRKQDEPSFTESNVKMFDFYGGVTETVNLDNLKSGVIVADGTNPVFNKTYAEVADHYDFFIDPSRVRTPTDKGKIERFIPSARRLFKRLREIHPDDSLEELNKKALDWCRNEYGMTKHGTTGIEPLVAFNTIEKEKLKKLPEERYKIVKWKPAKVHPDQFVQFENKRYGLPSEYRGADVWVKKVEKMVHIYHNSLHIRQFVIPKYKVAYENTDFPEDTAIMMQGGYPKYILEKARSMNNAVLKLITQILKPHANLNARCASGLLKVLEKYQYEPYFEDIVHTAIKYKVRTAKDFTKLFEMEKLQLRFKGVIPDGISPSVDGIKYTRSSSYYFN